MIKSLNLAKIFSDIGANTIATYVLGFLPLIYWLYKFVNIDLWYDEVYSLEYFVLVDFSNTLTDYHAPNNHIFFNLFHQLITRLADLRDARVLAENVYILRSIQGLVAICVGLYSVKLLRRFFNLDRSEIAILILFTTIPFMNFSLQLRGYNLSSLFLLMIIYHSWSYMEGQKAKHAAMVSISSMLLIYTIPSNAYMLIPIGMAFFVLGISNWGKDNQRIISYFKSIVLIGIGLGIATLLYIPVFDNLISNRFSSKEAESLFYSLELLPRIFLAFISERYLLIIPVIIGLRELLRRGKKIEREYLLVLLFILLFPFLISFLHQKHPFERVFISLAPVFCILLSLLTIYFLQYIKRPLLSGILLYLIMGYCIAVFLLEEKNNNSEVAYQLVAKKTLEQNIYRNYYLSDFYDPMGVSRQLAGMSDNEHVFVFDHLDHQSTRFYLYIHGLAHSFCNSMDEIGSAASEHGKVFVVTSNRSDTMEKLKDLDQVRYSSLTEGYSFNNIIRVDHIAASNNWQP